MAFYRHPPEAKLAPNFHRPGIVLSLVKVPLKTQVLGRIKCIHRFESHEQNTNKNFKILHWKHFPMKTVWDASYELDLVPACRKDLDFHHDETETKTGRNHQARGYIGRPG